MASDNVGLSTPRGSGTSGYVQRNLSNLRPRDRDRPYPSASSNLSDVRSQHRPPVQRKPDSAILEHDRRRQIEVKVLELRDELEEEGSKDEEEIDEACDKLREKLQAEYEERQKKGGKGGDVEAGKVKGLKAHQVHELAEAKIKESEKLRRALGIREDYQEGGHWKSQEEKIKARETGMRKGRGDDE